MKFRLIFFLMFVAAFSSAHAQTPVKIIARDAFVYVKTNKVMLGGDIQVRDSVGNVISSKRIDQCKMYLDLFELRDGNYNVTVQHHGVVFQFTYTVESPKLHVRRKHPRQSNDHVEILSEKKQVRYV